MSKKAEEEIIAMDTIVDVTSTAKEAGFRVPVALTIGVQTLCEVPEGVEGQDYKGRLWDTLFCARMAYRRWKTNRQDDGRIIPFRVGYQYQTNKTIKTLWLVFNEHTGFIIMLPEEY